MRRIRGGQSFDETRFRSAISKLDNAETVQAYPDATPEAFKLEDDQPIIVTLEMRATEALIDLRWKMQAVLFRNATVTWTARLTPRRRPPGLRRRR